MKYILSKKSGKNTIFGNNIYIMSRKRGLNKSKVSFSIDKEISQELEEYCNSKMINKSKLINSLIKKFLKNEIVNGKADSLG